MKPYTVEKMKKILEGNSTYIQEQLILSGLFMLVFESFKDYAVKAADSFFQNIKSEEGKITLERGQEFEILIKNHGVGKKGQHKNKEFRAALKFFLDLQAISLKDYDQSERLYNLRNDIGHELFNIFINDKKDDIKLDDVILIFVIYLKIKIYEFREIEVAINPEPYKEINLDEVQFPDIMILKGLILQSLEGKVDEEYFLSRVTDLIYKSFDNVS